MPEEEPDREAESDHGGELAPAGEGEALCRNLTHPLMLDGMLRDVGHEATLKKGEFPSGFDLLIHRCEKRCLEVRVTFFDLFSQSSQVRLSPCADNAGDRDDGKEGHPPEDQGP